MLFNSDKDQYLLSESLRRAGDIPTTLKSLDYVIQNHSPFSLYIATKDRSDCLWIFDPQIVCYMIGGIDNYNVAFDAMFVTPEERKAGIIMFVLSKTGPLVSLRLEEELLVRVSNDLRKVF